MKYALSRREINFITNFRLFRVETLWVEVRKNPDRIVSFIYVPSRKKAGFIFSSKLTKIAPVYILYPFDGGNSFVFGVQAFVRDGDRKVKAVLRSIVNRNDVINFINSDWDRDYIKSVLEKKPSFIIKKGYENFPKDYSQLKAKRVYSELHFEAKKDAYMFDVDVALIRDREKDFLALLEYKHGKEKQLASYNEKVGYSILSDYYRTFLVVGENSYSIYDFKGFSADYIDRVPKEKIESFFTALLRDSDESR